MPGDYLLPNILVSEGKIRRFIDLGKMGAGNRYWDLAEVRRSIRPGAFGPPDIAGKVARSQNQPRPPRLRPVFRLRF